MKKKIFSLSLLVLIAIYFLWLGYHLLSFKRYKAPLEFADSEVGGAYHIHSKYSDGQKDVDKIVKIAALSALDFIILTDHGHPNFECLRSQGWKEGLLVLAGSELSSSRGHLVALAFDEPILSFSQNAELAAEQIQRLKGYSVIAHPYSKVKWSWGKSVPYQGLEIISGDSMLKKNFISCFPYLPALFIKPEYTLIKMIYPPYLNLRKWDELNNHHSLYGYFSVDAHLLYKPLFSLLHLHLLLEKPLPSDFETAKKKVYNTLRKGRFYNAIDAVAETRGFRFWAKKEEKTIPMGKTLILDSPVTLLVRAPFSFAKEIHLIHNGKTILRSHKRRMIFQAEHPGTYRVEVYLKEKTPLDKKVPWIISNPIFLREEKNDNHRL